jgi:hypothetical protein
MICVHQRNLRLILSLDGILPGELKHPLVLLAGLRLLCLLFHPTVPFRFPSTQPRPL